MLLIPMYDELIGNLRAQATHFHFNDETSLLLLKAADAIEELSNIQIAPEKIIQTMWIPVTERLPEKIGYYLAHIANINQISMASDIVALWDGNLFYVGDFVAVTHWMPLPEPPKEKT